MGVLSPPLHCPDCRTLVQHADTGGRPIVVEPGQDPHGDVVIGRQNGRLRARHVQPGETIPRTQARLVEHRCEDAARAAPPPRRLEAVAPQPERTLHGTKPTQAMVKTLAGMLDQGFQLEPPAVLAIAALVERGLTVEALGTESTCHGGCGRTVTHPPNTRPFCDECGASPAGRRSARRRAA
ncbi:hypothetical protein [Dactylosporangium sp. CS-033363]|uniref:hypothetical protein n=1 Tax=Dactylosporangium sp. CS-033363 TaxID=3239935 RepID=UPI003D89B18C